MALSDLFQPSADPTAPAPQRQPRTLVTCALPYVNNVPHLGNLVPIVSADVYARYLKLRGVDAIYICATDEHGTRTEIEAKKAGLDEDTYCLQLHERLLSIFDWLNVRFSHFGRTSSPHNHRLTQEIFKDADKNGAIEARRIQQLYCQPCQRYLPDTYLTGICPYCHTAGAQGDQCDACGRFLDPLELEAPQCKTCGATPEVKSTEHLFLKLDALSPRLDAWLAGQSDWEGVIVNMPRGWIREGLRPRAITRDLKWGVAVPKPGFEDKVFYVWFDAPIGYIAATSEWAEANGASLDTWWKAGETRLVHFLGKDNVPFHTLMWPATLMAADAGWNLPDFIAANEYLTYEGGAFSKSRGLGVFCDDLVEMGFPADAVRFYLMANRPEKRDADFSFASFSGLVNADLVGNFGNLCHRLLSFIAKRYGEIPAAAEPERWSERDRATVAAVRAKETEIDRAYASVELRAATRHLLELSDIINKFIQDCEPWRTFKSEPGACATTLHIAAESLYRLARWAWPIMPQRCEQVLGLLGNALDEPFRDGVPVGAPEVLFAPIEKERIEELEAAYRGAGVETLPPLEFVKEPEVSWPCVILEFTDLVIRRRVNAVERLKEAWLAEIDPEEVLQSERLQAYRDGLAQHDRGGRVVSVQNLAEIVARSGRLPNVNTLVDIYNLYSLRHALVMGAYERKTIHGRLIYAAASGKEHFVPVAAAEAEPIEPGEWVLKDERDLVVTKVTTKQAAAAAVTTSTTACAMCIQGIDGTDVAELRAVAEEMAKSIVKHCQGGYRVVFAG